MTRPRWKNPLWATFRALVRTRVTTGLILVLPIWLCVVLLRFIFEVMRDSSMWLVEAVLLSDWGLTILESWNVKVEVLKAQGLEALPLKFQWAVSISAVLLTIVILYSLGLIAANLVGRRMIGKFENLVNRMPLIKTVYNSAKQVLVMVGGEDKQQFSRVVLVAWPNPSMRAVAFVTSSFRDGVTGEELCTVFIASTPNPTTGFAMIVRKSELTEVPWSVEEAMSYVIGGGIIVPQGIVTMKLNNAADGAGAPRPGSPALAGPPAVSAS